MCQFIAVSCFRVRTVLVLPMETGSCTERGSAAAQNEVDKRLNAHPLYSLEQLGHSVIKRLMRAKDEGRDGAYGPEPQTLPDYGMAKTRL
jgi:hypothetical protein